MANKQRNEVEVVIGSKTFTLKPTVDAIARIEDFANMNIFQILKTMNEAETKTVVLRAMLIEGIRGAKGAVDIEEIDDIIEQEGTAAILPPLIPFAMQAFSGQPKQNTSEKKEPTAAKSK